MTHQGGTVSEAWIGACRLERHADGRLEAVAADGTRHAVVEVRRAFPLSDPGGPVAVVAADGSELAWVPALTGAEPGLRWILEEALAREEFLPVIERIEAVSHGRPAEWSVVTDRGPRRFASPPGDGVAREPDGGAFVTDTFGVRYRIPSVDALDPRSRRLFERAI